MASKKQNNQMAMSDFNMQKLSTKDLEEHIAASINMGNNVIVIGQRGTGKTIISKDQIRKAGMKEVYLNLSVVERTDLAGYPDLFGKEAFVKHKLPSYFQALIEGDEECVLLLDEVDKASPELLAPLLELTQFRKINGVPLKNLKAVIMTGNLIAEGGTRPSLPLLDRAEVYLTEASVEHWINWSGKSGRVHPSITAFITDYPQELFGPVDPEERYATPSPRSWEAASNIVKFGELNGWSTELVNKKVSSCVGKEAGIKFSTYFEHYQVLLPLVADIFNGKLKEVKEKYKNLDPSRKLVSTMICCSRVAHLMDTSPKSKELEKALENVGQFMDLVPIETVLLSIRSQIQIQRIVKFKLEEHKAWSAVFNKTNKMLGS